MVLAGEYRRNRRECSPSDTCSTTNPHTRNILGLNPGPSNERSAINRLNKPQHEKEPL